MLGFYLFRGVFLQPLFSIKYWREGSLKEKAYLMESINIAVSADGGISGAIPAISHT